MKIEECFFIDNDTIKKNILLKYSSFKFEKIVLSNDYQKKKYEGESNNYYKIIKINNKYKIYYRASNNSYMINGKFNMNYDYNLNYYECQNDFCVYNIVKYFLDPRFYFSNPILIHY